MSHFKPAIDPIPQTVFPTAGDLREVVEQGMRSLPITDKNVLTVLLMTYHNTLLAKLKEAHVK